MFDILLGTPLWVYAVFFVLTYYGVIGCFKNHVSKRSLQITPALFVAISLASLTFSQNVAVQLAAYSTGLLAGCCLALRFYSYKSAAREGECLVLGGSIKVLIVYWGYFGWRYYSGYQAAIHPELSNEMLAVAQSALAAGLINGLIVGRSVRLLRFFRSEASVESASKVH